MPKSSRSDLASLQSNLASWITGSEEGVPGSRSPIVAGGKLSPESALKVYQLAYLARLTEALGETFEAVWRVLGDDEFFRTAEAFIREEMSFSYNLSDYGKRFPDHLECKWNSEFPFLSHLARFEWAFKEIFHAPQHHSLSAADLAALDESEEATITLGKAVFPFSAPFSIYELWKKRKDASISLSSLHLDHPQHLIIYKTGNKIFVKSLTASEWELISALNNGETLSSAMNGVAEIMSKKAVSTLFQEAFAAGWFSSILPKGKRP